jgi:methylmalonyl-CoA mutase C-terminal domain/subunit
MFSEEVLVNIEKQNYRLEFSKKLYHIREPMKRNIRFLICKPGLDGHDRGVKVLARAFRDAGIEVIYTGLRQTPEQIVSAAVQEDVDAIGLSIHSGAHNALLGKVLELLKSKGANEILVFAGGIIPTDDAERLKEQGIIEIFGPGTSTDDIVWRIQNEILERRRGRN